MAYRRLRYHLVDVFTDCIFGGNPLAVLTNARGLSSTTMQAIANEFNLSETAFVLPPKDAKNDHRIRIFTPITELPVAGHPTIGTAFVLAREFMVDRNGETVHLRFEEDIGVIPVSIRFQEDRPAMVQMTQPLPAFGARFADVDILAEMLAIEPAAIQDTELPAQVVSCGMPFLIVPVRDLAAIRRVRLRRGVWEQVLRDYEAPHLFVFTREVEHGDSTVHSRMFAPALGIAEDPASGGASGPLGSYLVHHRAIPIENTTTIINEQGFEMGRPSIIRIEIDSQDGAITGVRVGGTCCAVGEGVIELK